MTSSCLQLDPCKSSVPTIIMGEDKILTVQLQDQKTKEFIDISGATEIIALFMKSDNTALQKKLSLSQIVVISGLAGKFQIILTSVDTASLMQTPADSYSSIEIRLTIASKLTIVKLENTILVAPKLFPDV